MKRFFRLPGDNDREVDDEVQFHIDQKVDRLVAGGMSRSEAEVEARRRFGNLDEVRAAVGRERRRNARRARRVGWLSGWSHDIRFAIRQLVRNPVFSVVALTTLALGIGANTAVYSVVDGILFRPLPFTEPHELVTVWSDVSRRGGPEDEWLSYANFYDLKQRGSSLDALAAWGGWGPTWTDPDEPEALVGAAVSAGMFSEVLRVDPHIGRPFTSSDDHPDEPTRVLVSHSLWLERLGGSEDVVGRRLALGDVSAEVIGVMPATFRPPFVPEAQLWRLFQLDVDAQTGRRGGFSFRAMGRVRDGGTVDAAALEFERLGEQLETEYPNSNTGMSFAVVPLRDDMVSDARSGLLALLGAVGLVLLVTCLNVANLLVGRALGRQPELGLRSSLGAGRKRLLRQLLTESLLLAVIGGAIGVMIAFGATGMLVRFAPEGTPRIDEIAVNGRVLLSALGITVAAGLLFGIAPALRGLGGGLSHGLREGGRGAVGQRGQALRRALVASQVALAVILLAGAGLLGRTLQNLRTAELGFEAENVLTSRLFLPASRYPDAATRTGFYNRLEENLAALPGVESVGLTSTVPLSGQNGDVDFLVEGRPIPEPGEETAAWFRRVTPGYFPTMQIQVNAGRPFGQADRGDAPPVVIVNTTLAERFFPDENPLGKRLNFNGAAQPVWREIVGVAEDVRNFGIRESSRFAVYVPYAQLPSTAVSPVIRSTTPTTTIIPGLRRAVADLDPTLAVAGTASMTDLVRREIGPERFLSVLLAAFAMLAFILAVVGLYGIVAYSVRARMPELGVRQALGADGTRLTWLVMKPNLTTTVLGVALGLFGITLGARYLASLLYGVAPIDPPTLIGVTLALLGAATVASALPALKAARSDPTRALRAD